MLFPTVQFALFFPVVLVLSWALIKRQALWKPFIIVASYVFYGYADWRFCVLLAAITIGNQWAARLIARTEGERARSWILGVAVALDLLVLGVFKYYGFFVESWDRALGPFSLPLPLLTIALPVGVSFFTFQAISYVVDVKRRLVEPASMIDVAIYLSFFPHLVAGPIVRAREFLPQLQQPPDPRKVAVGSGLALIALGLVKKLAIADTLAREVVDPVFAVPGAYAAPDLWLAAYAYTAQIYCDFSGYTDMAIGLALLLGYVFPQNFRSPYRATGFSDFWRRWHMTLSRFLRDFLYIPLGGNRKGRWKTYRNLMITMVLGGLWHGAAWPFVLWGVFHGAMLCAERAWGARVTLPAWFRWGVTFHLVVFGWILFRSPDMDIFGAYVARMVEPGPATLFTVPIALMVLAVIGLQLVPERTVERVQVRIERTNPVVLGAGLAVVIALVAATVSSQGVAPFIYFRF
ncbi:MBOAT family protein [Solirubrobacter sp. CPCC 204708]|uniref:MBOAT family protein n=1 Tax=Solirubrobacter deserti TaxID=2282478 RepID=A0ABT4RUD4_9ACTN|nr:MBOAT family protein [Solirubrobacter deserti]MBE2319170.1 MBOAT family protein [Solirubrobacter deserti]MDA0142196.1 MBOAT family protein [Solirubrobacter deserti]